MAWSSLRNGKSLMRMSVAVNLNSKLKTGSNSSTNLSSTAAVIFQQRCSFAAAATTKSSNKFVEDDADAAAAAAAGAYGKQSGEDVPVPTSGISRPLSEILKELNKKVPDSLISARTDPNGSSVRFIPWHIVNRIMNLHAPEWSGEVRSITYSADGKSVSVVYRITLYGTDAEIYRESTGTASVDEPGFGDAVQKAEAMAFRRACARLGLGLHLYHEDTL